MIDDFCYDIETYRNLFCVCTVHIPTGTRFIHEVSPRIDQSSEYVAFINELKARPHARLVGYNNEAFDYPVIHALLNIGPGFTALDAYNKAQQIIGGGFENRFQHMIWESDRHVPQVDLFKIHHFDNQAKATSLKALEIAMRSASVVDLPYDPHTDLTFDQMDEIIAYMCHDVSETVKFYGHSKAQLEFRDSLTEMNATNYNDTKIGEIYFINKLEAQQPGICFDRSTGRKQPQQTHRPVIALRDVILQSVVFSDPEFNRILDYMKSSEIRETKGFFKDLHCTVNGFQFDFGTGGIHGSVEKQTFYADDEFEIIDVDVASYYPNLAIANDLYPEHLGRGFCDIYKNVYDMRKSYAKGTPENAMLKLALNGMYGKSNSKYSAFYDPQYTMAITINGQLLLCMLAEWIMNETDSILIQINTDGLTVRCPRNQRQTMLDICRRWETTTGLELEDVNYSRMFVRDVNNYVAEYTSGDVKRKGAYDYDVGWHQNHSSLVVPKAVEAHLINGVPVRHFIQNHTDFFDFCRTAKVQRNSRLVTSNGDEVQRTTRYHIARNGVELFKIMPPLPKKPDVERSFAIDKGFQVQVCNDIHDFDWNNLNREWYINEAQKLVKSVGI